MSEFGDECPSGQCKSCWDWIVEYVQYAGDYEDVTLDGTFSKAELIHIVSHLVDIPEEARRQ